VARVSYAVEKTKLAAVIEKPIANLSRGFRQRLGVAQAILNSPSLLILDEPTNGLDPSQILEMRSLIRELSETATIVISTHILQEVQALCGRVIIINGGEVALDSDLQSLQSASRLLVSLDREPQDCEKIFAQCRHLELKGHEKKGNQFWYTLQCQSDKIEEATPEVVQRLVEGGCKIYQVQPLTRDLETIFGEITAGAAKMKPSLTAPTTINDEAAAAIPALVNSADTAPVANNDEGNSDAN
jgi:ABC-2 type transport system ATP-binding protein